MKGAEVDVDGGVVDDCASGGLTQKGELASPAAGGGSTRAGSTVLMKLSLNSASSSGLPPCLLCSRLVAMALASHRVAPSSSSSSDAATATPLLIALPSRAMAATPALRSSSSSRGRYICGFRSADRPWWISKAAGEPN